LNIVSPIELYERGVCVICASLTRKDNVATNWGHCEVEQRIFPDELEHLLFRQEEGAVALPRVAATRVEGARRVRDNVDAFRVNVREDILSNVAKVIDCVDSIVGLVGHPNLAAVGPEALRHYSWSFNLTVS
jgi:hypothetical protein